MLFRKSFTPKNPFDDKEQVTVDDEKSLAKESSGSDVLPDVPVHLNRTFVPKNPFDSDMSTEEEEEEDTVRTTRYKKIETLRKKRKAPLLPAKYIKHILHDWNASGWQPAQCCPLQGIKTLLESQKGEPESSRSGD